ncbi:MAG: hypothetical protein LBN38_08805 [Verrucomicrobiota bacterium]|nr:hypothetical protein [Verrucomicrobiota bacterium]
MKKILVSLLVGLVLASTLSVAQDMAPEQVVTQPQLAELLVRTLGLVRLLPNAPSTQQMFDVLMQNGIVPEGGWTLDGIVTKADLARVLVQALRRTDDVENPNDPQSWINALREMGISLDRLSEAIQSVEALPDALAQKHQLTSTDPLNYTRFFEENVTQYGVDFNYGVRVLSEVEMISGEFRPISPTPH